MLPAFKCKNRLEVRPQVMRERWTEKASTFRKRKIATLWSKTSHYFMFYKCRKAAIFLNNFKHSSKIQYERVHGRDKHTLNDQNEFGYFQLMLPIN